MKYLIISLLSVFILSSIQGQQEMELRTDGLVVPKITNAQRPASPALGHLVYNTDQGQFEYFNGGIWVPFSSSPVPDRIQNSSITTQILADLDDIDFTLEGLQKLSFKLAPSGDIRMDINNPATENVFLGYISGGANTEGINNTFVGSRSGDENTIGSDNTFVGADAGGRNISGGDNTFIGKTAGFLNTAGEQNTYLGRRAGYRNTNNNNTFLGYRAGTNSDNPTQSVLIGSLAGESMEANNTTAIGYRAGQVIQSAGTNNTIVGHASGQNMTTGANNVYLGKDAGFENEDGSGNVAIGHAALKEAIRKSNNVAVGDSSMHQVSRNDDGMNSFGRNNTALGAGSLYGAVDLLTTNSVGIGYQAGYEGGSGSVFIGHQAGNGGSQLSNALYINNEAGDEPLIFGDFNGNVLRVHGELQANNNSVHLRNLGGTDEDEGLLFSESSSTPIFGIIYDGVGTTTNNRIHIREYNGTASDVMTFKADGNVGIGVDNPTIKLDVAGTVRGTSVFCGAINACSDVRLKRDFSKIEKPIEIIQSLDGYFHFWKDDEYPEWNFGDKREIGFKAQEVQEILPEVVEVMPEGLLSIDYAKIVPILTEALKDQQKMIEDLNKRISELEQK